jgi:hypothetical protein
MIKSRKMRGGHVTSMGHMRTAYNIFIGKLEGKTLCGRTMRRWEDYIILYYIILYYIIINLRERGWEGVGLDHLAQDKDQWRAHMKTVMNILVP